VADLIGCPKGKQLFDSGGAQIRGVKFSGHIFLKDRALESNNLCQIFDDLSLYRPWWKITLSYLFANGMAVAGLNHFGKALRIVDGNRKGSGIVDVHHTFLQLLEANAGGRP